MSLIHWWPLNGNTKDYGIRNIALTNNGATVNNNGKIGKTYEFDGSSSYLGTNLSSEVFAGTNHPFSIAFWMKFTDDISSRKIIFGNYGLSNSFFNIEMSYGSSAYNGRLRFDWLSSIDHWFPATGIQNVWQHYVVTFDGTNKISMYFNGSLVESFTGTLAPVTETRFFLGRDSRTGDTALKGFLNDFRIYNHCLSVKEVKEISKGLVLHYNFEDPYAEGTTNLFAGRTDFSNTSHWSRNQINSTAPTVDSEGNMKLYGYATDGNHQSYTFSKNAGYTSISASTTYTLSVWVKYSSTSAYFNMYFYEQNSSGSATKTNSWRIGCTSEEVGHWVLRSKTVTTQSTTTRMYAELNCYNCPASDYIIMKNNSVQLEQKDHATPFVNGTRPNGIIYDNSGYGYNGTIVGDCQIIPESKSGNYSLFNNSTNIGTSTSTGAAYVKGDLKNSYTPNEITISFWANVLDYNYQNSGILSLSNNGDYPVDYYDNGVHQYDSGFRFNLSITPNVLSSTSLIVLNEWHLYTLTYDGSSLKSYRDGNLIETVSGTGYINAFKYIYLGLNVAGGAWRQSKEYWGDFKIYSTALSASDILAEYNRKASIDRNGNLFTGEFVEINDNTNITKTDIIKSSHFEEGTSLVKMVDGYTELEYIETNANQIINTGVDDAIGLTIDCDMEAIGDGKRQYWFGSTQGPNGGSMMYNGIYNNTGIEFNWLTVSRTASGRCVMTQRLSGDNYIITMNNETFIRSKGTTAPTGKMYIFGCNGGSRFYGSGLRCYYFTMYGSDGSLVRNFIPAKRKDNVIGMYDTINRVFYTNSGTGSFTAGPEKGNLSIVYSKQIIEN